MIFGFTRPLRKVFNHFSVLQAADRHTHTHFFHENPRISDVKGTTKKAEALELFVYPNLLDRYQLGLVACDSFQTSLITDEAVTEKVTADLRLPERFPRHSLGCAAGSKLVEPS